MRHLRHLRIGLLAAVMGLALLTVPLLVSTAEAGAYLNVNGSLPNLSELNGANTGYAGEVGWTNGTFSLGVEASNYMHNGDATAAGAVNVTVTPWDWVVSPYGTVGAGWTFEGDPLVQYGGGFLWNANDEGEAGSFGIYAGYEWRQYLDSSFESIDQTGYAKLGMLLTF